MLRAFTLACGQLLDRAILAILIKSMAITLAIFALLGWLGWLGLGLALTPGDPDPFFRAILAVALAVLLGWVLFRLVALAVLQLFGDEVVRAVEARHYPQAAGRKLGLHEELRVGLRSLLRALGYNLLALPLALLSLATAVGPALVFGTVNAVLLGRELTEMVALRHPRADGTVPLPPAATRAALGAVVVVLLTVPFVNFMAPLIGAAMATHLVHAKGRPNDAA
ncbi:MAG TPA: EI24 domain-containing protein [Novosphingobium sp.]|nr:EI24 domain-containing protein [Novosphingobium sp.]